MDDKKSPISNDCGEWVFLSLHEVSLSFGVPSETIIDIFNEGIVNANTNDKNEWQFDSEAFRRIRIVLQLNRDLGVNVSGAGLALDLLDEIERLRLLLANKE